MKYAFCLSLLWLVYVYGGYAIALLIVSRFRGASVGFSDATNPSVSVLIAARNEAADIGWKVAETLAWAYPADKLEILVASDASEDSTDAIVRRFGDPRVSLLRMGRRGGKGRALNQLAKLAKGEILFFTDANTHIEPHTLRLMTRHFADSRVGCVTGYTRHVEGGDPALTNGAGAYESYESILKHLESRIGSVLACDGAIFCMRASLYHPLSPDLANDLELPMRAAASGNWIIQEPAAFAFERDTSSPLEEFNRRRRMSAQGMLAMFRIRGAFRGLRGWQFVSHKLLRWLLLIPMTMLLVASVARIAETRFFAALFGLQIAFYACAGTGFARTLAARPVPRFCAVPFYIVLGMVASLVGVAECCGGRRFDVWEIPTLSRSPVRATTTGE
jgi:cellulose synthase/poly-beta-1,6-N-acetylglucosamine synthase-like glycosyltransferase